MRISKNKKVLNSPAWMLGSSRAARNTQHVFISLSPPLTNFTPKAFKGCSRPPSGLQRGLQSLSAKFTVGDHQRHLEIHIEMQKTQQDMYKWVIVKYYLVYKNSRRHVTSLDRLVSQWRSLSEHKLQFLI